MEFEGIWGHYFAIGMEVRLFSTKKFFDNFFDKIQPKY
jgi:hypothetical protein